MILWINGAFGSGKTTSAYELHWPVLEKRLNKRLQRGETWAKAQIDRCLYAFTHHITEEKIMTDQLSIDDVVQEIASRSGLVLLPDYRSPLKKWKDRMFTLLRHIRKS